MLKFIPLLSILAILAGCEATTAPPYEKDKIPENRTNYSGAEGLIQQQKDQQYLMTKEQQDKCEQGKLDLLAATSEGKGELLKQFEAEIERSCR